jgi:hypothetical protein
MQMLIPVCAGAVMGVEGYGKACIYLIGLPGEIDCAAVIIELSLIP